MPDVSVAALRTRLTPAAPVLATASADAATPAPRPWKLLVLACLGLAALSLLGPSSPTYDPWAWIIWGREITHLDLTTTSGPSWKPLPVFFTTSFALFGDDAGARACGCVDRARRRPARDRDGLPARRRGSAGRPAGVIAAVALLLADELRPQRSGAATPRALLVALVPVGGRAPPRRPPRRRLPARLRARRCCGRRCGRSSASTGCGSRWVEPRRRLLVRRRVRRQRRAVVRAGVLGLGRLAARRPTARTSRTRTRPRSPTARSSRCSARSCDDPLAAGAARRRSSRSCAPVRERRWDVRLLRSLAAATVADDRRRADDRGRASPATCATSRCPPRSCACSPASAGSSSSAPRGRALRARRRGRRSPPCSRWRRAPFVISDLGSAARRRQRDPLGGRLLRLAARGDRQGRRARRDQALQGLHRPLPGPGGRLVPATCPRGEVGIDPKPPGIVDRPALLADRARPALPAAHRRPRKWVVRRRLRAPERRFYPAAHGDLRLAPGVGAAGPRPLAPARVVVPVGLASARLRSSLGLRNERARRRLLGRRGPVGRDRRPAADRHPRRPAPGRLAAALLHACCTSGCR